MVNLIPTMTSNTTPSGVAYAITKYGPDYDAWKMFDKDDSTYWLCSGSGHYHWVSYVFPTSNVVNKYSLTARDDGGSLPEIWTLYGSTTGEFTGEEVELDSQTAQSFSAGEKKEYSFSNTTPYLGYKIKFTAYLEYVGIAEMELGADSLQETILSDVNFSGTEEQTITSDVNFTAPRETILSDVNFTLPQETILSDVSFVEEVLYDVTNDVRFIDRKSVV